MIIYYTCDNLFLFGRLGDILSSVVLGFGLMLIIDLFCTSFSVLVREKTVHLTEF